MLLARRTIILLFLSLALLSLAACETAPTLIPAPLASPTAEAPTVQVALSTDTLPPAVTATLTPAATQTVEASATASPSVTPETNGTETPPPGGTATPANTDTPTPTPCFGSIVGRVLVDVKGIHQVQEGEPGAMGAVLYLKNSTSIVGLYTTGSGEYSFPGLVAGAYDLSVTAPQGYQSEDPSSAELTVGCGATVTQDFLIAVAGAAPPATSTPTAAPAVQPATTPVSAPSASASGSGFTPFTTGPAYYLSGCGSITSPGLYLLTTSLVSQWDCVQIFSDNVILDCQGNSLNGVDDNGYGVVVHHTSALFGRPVRNVEIRNCNMTQHKYGIFIDAADNLSIHDNNASGNFNDVDRRGYGVFLGLVEGGGIRVNDTRGAFVGNNRTDGEGIGLDIRMSNNITLRGNFANGNSAWGIHFYGVQNSEISSNVSSNNLRYCTWGSGVVGAGCDAGGIMLQSGSNNNVVQDNTISGSNGNGIFIKAHGEACGNSNTIVNNRIVGALYNAIELSFCQNNHLDGNEISNSLDGIWMGFAVNNEVAGGNYLHDMTNHGIISWNSQGNNVSNNRIVNSREGLYFYSSDYDKQEFWFVPGAASDHVSRGNCLCANTLANNSAAAFHLANSIKNQMTNNTLVNNGTNFLLEGNTSGNVIEGNVIQGGTFNWTPRPEPASAVSLRGPLAVFDRDGNPVSRERLLRALETDSPFESPDLRWFKYKLRVSLGAPQPEVPPAAGWPALISDLQAFLAAF